MKKNSTDTDFEDDIPFYRVSGMIRIVVIGIMCAVCIVCIAGFFGYGWWTTKTAGDADDILIEYECLLRVTKETPLTCTVHPNPGDSVISISLSNEYLSKVEIRNVQPQPSDVIAQGDRLTYVFTTPPDDHVPQPVCFTTVAKTPGKISAIVYSARNSYAINHFIYP
jgi:hypothetical protein